MYVLGKFLPSLLPFLTKLIDFFYCNTSPFPSGNHYFTDSFPCTQLIASSKKNHLFLGMRRWKGGGGPCDLFKVNSYELIVLICTLTKKKKQKYLIRKNVKANSEWASINFYFIVFFSLLMVVLYYWCRSKELTLFWTFQCKWNELCA